MNKFSLLFTALVVCATNSFAQIKVTKIKADKKERYIATTIGYPIIGQYNLINQKEPVTILNQDGTGIIQNEDLTKENIIWGIECSESGVPVFKEGFNSASYSLWYKKSDASNSKSTNDEEWTLQSFSIHYDKKKMFISGERVKEYVE